MDEDFNTEEDDDGGGNEWLATYGDLVTLLLCFFVLLFAMSSIDVKKFQAAAASFAGGSSIGLAEGGDSILEQNQISEMNNLYKEVKELLDNEGLNSNITVEQTEKGVLLVFKDDLLFDLGKAELKPSVKKILYSFGNILRVYNKRVRIEGHTDNIPIKTSMFASNWELSTARAISVAKYFTEELPSNERIAPSNFEVAGLSEYSPVAPNDTPENRQKNRRIEVIVLE